MKSFQVLFLAGICFSFFSCTYGGSSNNIPAPINSNSNVVWVGVHSANVKTLTRIVSAGTEETSIRYTATLETGGRYQDVITMAKCYTMRKSEYSGFYIKPGESTLWVHDPQAKHDCFIFLENLYNQRSNRGQ